MGIKKKSGMIFLELAMILCWLTAAGIAAVQAGACLLRSRSMIQEQTAMTILAEEAMETGKRERTAIAYTREWDGKSYWVQRTMEDGQGLTVCRVAIFAENGKKKEWLVWLRNQSGE